MKQEERIMDDDQERRLREIVDHLTSIEYIRRVTGYDPSWIAELQSEEESEVVITSALGKLTRASEWDLEEIEEKKFRDGFLEMLAQDYTLVLPISHFLCEAEKRGYTWEVHEKGWSRDEKIGMATNLDSDENKKRKVELHQAYLQDRALRVETFKELGMPQRYLEGEVESDESFPIPIAILRKGEIVKRLLGNSIPYNPHNEKITDLHVYHQKVSEPLGTAIDYILFLRCNFIYTGQALQKVLE